jgi:hypothetical protein
LALYTRHKDQAEGVVAADQAIEGCFLAGGYFASHVADKDRAFEWLGDLRKRGIGWGETKRALDAYMISDGWERDNIDQQLKRAESMMRAWLFD